jgi:predicted O-methyltransferase YrrM
MTFEEVFPTLPTGWLARDEAELLWQYAQQASLILEIGSYCGRSSRLLAHALRPGARLFCCDPFVEDAAKEKALSPREIVADWCQAVCTSPAALSVSLLWMNEQQLFDSGWRPQLDLLYVDGDHSYEATFGAIQRWAPHASVIALHDYQSIELPGVTKAADDYGLGKPIRWARHMAIFDRRCA